MRLEELLLDGHVIVNVYDDGERLATINGSWVNIFEKDQQGEYWIKHDKRVSVVQDLTLDQLKQKLDEIYDESEFKVEDDDY